MEYENARDIAASWDRVFLYGDTGSSKTLQASMWPEPLMLFPTNERSIDTVAGRPDVFYKSIHSSQEMEAVVLDLLKRGAKLPALTVVWESVSHYVDLYIDELTGNGRKAMQQQDWGKLRSHMLALTNNLMRLDAHVIFTALAEAPYESKSGAPKIQGSTRDLMPSVCRSIIYMEARSHVGKPVEWHAHTMPYRGYYARDRRYGVPTDILIGPTPETSLYAQIFAPRVAAAAQ